MADSIRITFPAALNLADLELPVTPVTPGKEWPLGDDLRVQLVQAGEWSMERTLDAQDRTVPDGEDDADLTYVQAAIASWTSWYAWLQVAAKDELAAHPTLF